MYGEHSRADARDFASYLAAKAYKARNKGDPYYVEAAVAGVRDGDSYLCCVDLYGNQYQTNVLTTGIARMLCPPIIDARYRPDMPVEDAKAVLLDCFKALYARYSLADREVALCVVSEESVREERAVIDIPYNFRGYVHKEDIM